MRKTPATERTQIGLVVLALGLFAYQLLRYNGLGGLVHMFLVRAGRDPAGAEYAQHSSVVFRQRHIPAAYGKWATILLWGGLALIALATIYASGAAYQV